ncbi:IclR family transcriptional regulator [Rhodococcus sp. SRB_17]|nr:IclR family transcriptional regulator [Rhodococcus sp. SRB_17]
MHSAAGAEGSVPTSTLGRIALVIGAFEGRSSLPLAEIMLVTQLPRSSAHRMVEGLVQMGWLSKRGRDYSLGLRLVELGSTAVHQNRVHTAASQYLYQLYRTTGMTVHLAVLDAQDIVFLDKVGGPMNEFVPTRIGGRLPATVSALGQSLLAYNGSRVSGYGLIRERGIAVEMNSVVPGFGCIASPIGPIGEADAAISICGPLHQLAFDRRMITPVRLAAAAIWRSLNGISPTLQRRNLLRSISTAANVRAGV